MKRGRGPAQLVVAMALVALGCDDALFVDRDAMAGADAPDRNDGSTGTDGGATCDLLRRPERPTGAPDGDDGNQRLYLLWGFDVFPGEAWMTQGFDLDGVCTERDVGPSSCTEENIIGDGPRGVDNAYGSTLAGLLELQHPSAEEDIEAIQRSGYLALAVHIEGWNGQANDPVVHVFFAQSECVLPAGAMNCAAVPLPPPAWNGSDVAFLGQNAFSIASPDQPRVVDDAAYVVEGRLVAHLPDNENLVFSTGTVAIQLGLTDATFTATIYPDDGFIEDGVIAGRWGIADILDTTALLGLCPGEVMDEIILAQLRMQLDNAADIRSDSATDSSGLDCDALSAAIRFNQGFRAVYGGRLPPRPFPMPCL